ncbi:hypothetical protein [Spirillospora sp. CA-294931]|uniref:hypothetical protein n=1 Tax=Spirillospora sp. CA-294931 TaxID=3240042 RepID=UPI003D90C793
MTQMTDWAPVDHVPGPSGHQQDAWTSWGKPAPRGRNKALAIALPLGVLVFLGVAAMMFVLFTTPAGAAVGCGGG